MALLITVCKTGETNSKIVHFYTAKEAIEYLTKEELLDDTERVSQGTRRPAVDSK